MSLNTFKKVLDENPCLLELNICPLGEPLLRGDDFFAMAKYSRSQKIWTRTVTNATLLHINDNFKKLSDCDFNEVVISIDSFNETTYENLRRGSKLHRVLKNVEILHSYMKSSDIPIRTKLNMVICPDNFESIADNLSAAERLGFNNISLTVDPFNWGISSLDSINIYSKLDQTYLNHLANFYSKRKIILGFVFTNNKLFNSEHVNSRCSWPFSAMYIGSDLSYPPCCHIGDPSVYNVYNSSQGSMVYPLDVWNSEAYSIFRSSHLKLSNIPDVCKPCYK